MTNPTPKDGEDALHLFGVVRRQVSYGPRHDFVIPHDDSEPSDVRGPGLLSSRGPEDAKAPSYWKREAEAVLMALAANGRQVTSDDLRAHYPHHPSATGAAVGALFRSLAKQGRLTLVCHRPSTRPEARGRVVGVWQVPRG